MDELPPEHAGRIGLSLGIEPILTSLGGLERRVRMCWRRDAGAHRTRGLIPRPLRWVNWSATGRARHRLRVRGAGHGRGELAQVIVAVLSVDDKLQTCRGELCSSSASSGVRAQAPVPVFVPYADFFQFQAGAGRAAAARAAARGDAALPREDAPGSAAARREHRP